MIRTESKGATGEMPGRPFDADYAETTLAVDGPRIRFFDDRSQLGCQLANSTGRLGTAY
jgi:hypothetical protein